MSLQEYISRYYDEAAAVSSKNLPAAFILAHSFLESGKGESQLTKQANNFFGIKARTGEPSVTMDTTEIINGKSIKIPQKFRKYETARNSFKAYLLLLSNTRYKKVLEARTHLERAKQLKAAGYFTAGSNYINTLAKLAAQFEAEIKKRPNNTRALPIIAVLFLASILVLSNKSSKIVSQ
jgi:flagellum-specific peptidoglycan hydrolase FlgJ